MCTSADRTTEPGGKASPAPRLHVLELGPEDDLLECPDDRIKLVRLIVVLGRVVDDINIFRCALQRERPLGSVDATAGHG